MLHPSEDQSLFKEIEEDLQRQKIEALWKRFGPAILGVAAAIVLVTALISGWQTYQSNGQKKRTEALLEIMDKDAAAGKERLSALQDFAAANKGTSQALFARFHEAGLWAEEGKRAEALELYGAIAADSSVEPYFRQMADFLSVQTEMDTAEPAKLMAKLEPLMNDDASAWRFMASEYAGHLALRAGDKAKARAIFQKLVSMPGVPVSVLKRATDMLGWLDGGA